MSDQGLSRDPTLSEPVFTLDRSSDFAKTMSGGDIASKIPGAVAADKERAEAEKKLAKEYSEKLEGFATKRADADARLRPPIPPMMPAPQPVNSNPVEAWGSLAMSLAMLGSAFTRRPLVSSLNAAAEVMKAQQRKDTDAYRTALDRWKIENDYAIKSYEFQRDYYKDAVEMIGTDVKQAEALWKAKTVALGHPEMKQIIDELGAHGAVTAYNEASARLDDLKAKSPLIQDIAEAGHRVAVAQKALAVNPGDQSAQQELKDAMIAAEQLQRVSKGSGSAAAQNQEKEGDLYNRLVEQWHAEPKNAGKPFTADDEAAIRAKAHGSVYGHVAAPSKPGTETAFTEDAIKVAEANKGGPLTDAERGDVQKKAHADWAQSAATGRAEAGYDLSQKIYGDETIGMVADSFVAGNDHAMVGMARGQTGQYAMARVWKAVADKLATQEAAEFTEVYGRPPDATEQKVLDADRGRRLALAQAEFQGIKAGERTAFTRAAGLVTAAAEAKQFTPLAIDASSKVSRSQYPDFNRIKMAVQERTGNQNVINLHVANTSLADAFAQVIGRGNAQMTDGARAQAMGLLNKYWSEGQYETAVKMINKEIDAAQKAPEEVIKRFREGFLQRATAAPTADVGAKRVSPPRAAAPAGPPKVDSQAAYDALPSGTHFVGPDGKEWMKP